MLGSSFAYRRLLLAALVGGVSGALLTGCGDSTGPAGPPAEVRATAGSGQSAQVVTDLAALLDARVVDSRGRGVGGVEVVWTVTAGGGSITPLSGTTNGEGVASARWRLGSQAGEQTVSAATAELAGATFTATALPGPPSSIALLSGTNQSGAAGLKLALPLIVRVTDAFNNATPATTVTWMAVAGGGSVSPESTVTDAQGRAAAEWTLGPQPGPNIALARVGNVQPASFSATASTGPPALVERNAGEGQWGAVSQNLPAPLRVRVTDIAGNAIQGVTVTWATTGDASVNPATSVTDANGQASSTWRLGSLPTIWTATATVPGLGPVSFTARGVATLQNNVALSGLAADPGTPLFYRLSVPESSSQLQVTATGGSGLQLLVRRGQPPAVGAADCQGTASGGGLGCTIANPQPGDWFVLLQAAGGFGGVSLTAAVPFNVGIAGAYIVQATQTMTGSVPLVANRDGLLRVFGQANFNNSASPPVRVRLYQQGNLVATHTITSPGGAVPTVVSEDPLNGSWNLAIPGQLIQPGLSFLIDIDPDGQVQESDRSDNVFPRSGNPQPLDVRNVPPFRTRFVPVRQSANNLVGNITAANGEQFLVDTRKMLPLDQVDWDVRAEYTTTTTIANNTNSWSALLNEINLLRITEGSDRHYFGVVRTPYTGGVAGIAVVGGRHAVGWDFLPSASKVAAHEWGHNFGRWHAPCGGASGVDASFPYAGGLIGVFGLDVVTGGFFPPWQYRDIMGYCSPEWISDYTYTGIMDFRAGSANGWGEAGQVAAAGTAAWEAAFTRQALEPTLIVWGRINNQQMVLEPAFRLDAVPVLPDRAGPYTLEGFDERGGRLFSLSFAGEPVDDGPQGERQFAFAIPERMATPDQLARLRLSGPGGRETSLRAAAPAAAPDAARPAPALRRRPTGSVDMSWDAATFPMVVTRDPATRQILSIARGGSVTLPAAPAEVETILSDGVRSVSHRVAVPR